VHCYFAVDWSALLFCGRLECKIYFAVNWSAYVAVVRKKLPNYRLLNKSADIAFIKQVTGLKKVEIAKLKKSCVNVQKNHFREGP